MDQVKRCNTLVMTARGAVIPGERRLQRAGSGRSATSDQLKLAGPADRLAAASGRQLAVYVFEVRFERVDADVQLAGGLSGTEHV